MMLIAMHEDVEFEGIEMMDSTRALQDVNVAKDDHRNREGKPRRHRAARWGLNHYRLSAGRFLVRLKVACSG
jgi:hypothetical protein